ncbi:MAG: hypothetical protein J2P24_10805, partial [Streptosporangiales bacterium]|nr:hypothetical protein [Streptosporangiales bacterium]
ADLAAPPRGPCLFGFIGDCGASPAPTDPIPSSTVSTPAPTPTHTTAPSHHPTTAPPRSRHPHPPPTHHVAVRTTAPARASSTHHGKHKRSLPVAVTTKADPTPAGTTLSASDPVPATPDRAGQQEPTGMFRPLLQVFPVAVVCLATGIVVVVAAARRGSRRARAAAEHGGSRHRHSDSDAEELTHPGVWENTR